MKLTRIQYKILRVWLRYHVGGYGIGQLCRSCWKSWFGLGLVGALSYWITVSITPAISWGMVGLCLGAFLRDIGYYQVSRRTWPVTERLIDWKLTQELVDAYEKPAPDRLPGRAS